MNAAIDRFTRLMGAALFTALFVSHLCAPPARAVCTAPQLFAPAQSRPVPGRTNRVALGDFNGDGALDVAFPVPEDEYGAYSNRAGVLLGDGSGGFGPATYYTVGSRPLGICAADVDGDHVLDLVVTNWNANTLTLLHGAGDGTFSTLATLGCGVRPYDLVAADLNEDGVPDLVVASNGEMAISTMLGLGGGAFAAPVKRPLPDLGLGVAVGDINHDGHVDVAATAYMNGCVVFLGNGTGALSAGTNHATGPVAYTLALRDLNADGNLDLVVGNSSFAGVAVLEGNGAGFFAPPSFFGNGFNIGGVGFADLDGDGIDDLVATSSSDNTLRVFRGLASGGLPTGAFVAHSSLAAGTAPSGMALGDLDGDGQMDAVVACYLSGQVLTYTGGCFTPPPPPELPHLVSVRDVRNDQGGRVFLRWTRSSLDAAGVASITKYRLWRRLPPEVAPLSARRAAAEAAGAPADRRVIARASGPNASGVDFWEWIDEIPAQQLAGYGYAAPTLQDSTAEGNPYTAFFVTALTTSYAAFYESNVDSGYSVDNLAPPPPAPFAATFQPSGTVLHWAPSAAADVAAYRLYRGSSPSFVPGPANRIATCADTAYVDAGVTGGCYKLSALDVHGNEGPCALVWLTEATGVPGGSAALWLAPPGPNPARFGTRLRFGLSREGSARLAVHDLQGRLVAELARATLPAGEHSIAWDGRDRSGQVVRAGLYLVSLEAEGRRLQTRLVIAR